MGQSPLRSPCPYSAVLPGGDSRTLYSTVVPAGTVATPYYMTNAAHPSERHRYSDTPMDILVIPTHWWKPLFVAWLTPASAVPRVRQTKSGAGYPCYIRSMVLPLSSIRYAVLGNKYNFLPSRNECMSIISASNGSTLMSAELGSTVTFSLM